MRTVRTHLVAGAIYAAFVAPTSWLLGYEPSWRLLVLLVVSGMVSGVLDSCWYRPRGL